jgi:hypothetical protein
MDHLNHTNDRKRTEPMEDFKMSRRSFLKLSALAALTVGAGYTAGKMAPKAAAASAQGRAAALHAFLPGDPNLVSEVVRVFTARVGSAARLAVSADPQWTGVISAAVRQPGSLLSGGTLAFRMVALAETLPADILLGDNQQAVYAPESDYDPALRSLQAQVRGGQARYLFSAEFKEEGLLAGLWKPQDKVAVIRSGSSIVDRIPLDSRYNGIVVDGPQGKTVLSVADGLVRVESAACRNQLCLHSGPAAQVGDVIACAPNRLVVQVEGG